MMTATRVERAQDHASFDCRPELSEWSAVLAHNTKRRLLVSDLPGPGGLCELRREIMAAAQTYTERLSSISEAAGLGSVSPSHSVSFHSTCDAPIVATGHQPVVFHPGLLAKNRVLQELLHSEAETTGLMIIVDTDEGDGGLIRFPAPGRQLQTSSESISVGDSLYLSQRVDTAMRIADATHKIIAGLHEYGFGDAAERTEITMDQYARLAGQPVAIANTIVRRLWEHQPDYLEIPLSELCQQPAVQRFIRTQVSDGLSLQRTYNESLDHHRAKHKIENPANPFPNLSYSGRRIELPFWVLSADRKSRRVLTVDPEDTSHQYADGELLVPRGMMISAMLRLLVSDLFVHGTGGEHYDVCTDQFIDQRWHVRPPDFVTATETRYLFEEEVRRVDQVRNMQFQLHDANHRFRQYVSNGNFDQNDLPEATALRDRHETAVNSLNRARQDRHPAAETHYELKKLNREIAAFVRRVTTDGADLTLPTAAELKVLQERTFPFFFFP